MFSRRRLFLASKPSRRLTFSSRLATLSACHSQFEIRIEPPPRNICLSPSPSSLVAQPDGQIPTTVSSGRGRRQNRVVIHTPHSARGRRIVSVVVRLGNQVCDSYLCIFSLRLDVAERFFENLFFIFFFLRNFVPLLLTGCWTLLPFTKVLGKP